MSIKEFLKRNKCLSYRCLEREAGIPAKTIDHYMNGRRRLNASHISKLTPILERYGYDAKVSSKTLEDLWVTAYEGGSSYWAMTNIKFGDMAKRRIDDLGSTSEYLFKRMWYDGASYKIFDVESMDMLGDISKEAMLRGCEVLMSENPDEFKLIEDEAWDANTADIWFQYSVLGELVYG